jgi:hypothetical protein
MKRVIIPALIFIFTASVSLAAQKAITDTDEMIGKVKTVTVANPSKGTKSEVTILNDKSGEKVFLVMSTTTLYDTDSKAIGLDKIKVNEKVKIKYSTTKEGVHEAVSINIIK